MRKSCANCGKPVELINYAMGPEWMHIAEGASFPTERKGTAWRYCRTTVAAPAEKVTGNE